MQESIDAIGNATALLSGPHGVIALLIAVIAFLLYLLRVAYSEIRRLLDLNQQRLTNSEQRLFDIYQRRIEQSQRPRDDQR